MTDSQNFYYHFKPLNLWLLLNIIVTLLLCWCIATYRSWHYMPQFYLLIIMLILSWGAWIFKHFFKQKLATVTEEYIQIDHCQPLLWENVIDAREKIVKCCYKEFKVIILNTKPDMEYKYNFLQKHNRDFTPFSLPLYPVVRPEDIEALKEIISRKVEYTSLDPKEDDETD